MAPSQVVKGWQTRVPEAVQRSTELAFVASCCRPLGDPGRLPAIRAAFAALGPSGGQMLDTARRHRVEGLVADGVAAGAVPLSPAPMAALARQAARARMQTLRNAGEEVRTFAALRAAGIDALLLKGATLSVLAFGAVGAKTSWDVDVLVARGRQEDAADVLRGLGYRLTLFDGPVTRTRFRRLHRRLKESVWLHPERGTTVELHTALTNLSGMLVGIGLASPRIQVPVTREAALPTLAPPELFTFLAVHGSVHGWARLKWLADVAALLPREEPTLRAWRAQAIASGGGRCPDLALLLAHRLLGVVLPDDLLAAATSDRVTCRLEARCLRLLDRPGAGWAGGALDMSMADVIELAGIQAALRPGRSAGLRAWWSQLGRPYHADHLAVPTALLPAFMLAWLPGRLLSRRRRMAQREAGGKTATRP